MFENRKEFIQQVFITKEKYNLSLIDAIMSIVDENKLDIETAAAYVKQSHNLKADLFEEALALRMVEN